MSEGIKESQEGETTSSLVESLVRAAEQTNQKISQYKSLKIKERGRRAYLAFIKRMGSLSSEERALEDPLELIETINRKPELENLPPLYTINTRVTRPSAVGGRETRLVVVKIVPETNPQKTYLEAATAGWSLTIGTNAWDTPEGNRYLPGLIYLFRGEAPKDRFGAIIKEEQEMAKRRRESPPLLEEPQEESSPNKKSGWQQRVYQEGFKKRRKAALDARKGTKARVKGKYD